MKETMPGLIGCLRALSATVRPIKATLARAIFLLLAGLLAGCAEAIYVAAAAHDKVECLSSSDEEPLPPRTEGAFPFRLVYEVDDDRVVVEDTQVCKFKGRRCTASGRDDQWETTLASGHSQIVIRQLEKDREYVARIGECPVLMADPQYRILDDSPGGRVTLRIYEHGRFKYLVDGVQAQGIKMTSFEQWAEGFSVGP